MKSAEFSLHLNNFEDILQHEIIDIKNGSLFCDVTFVCDDYQQLEAHKMIMCACSPFLQNILQDSWQQDHHTIYLTEVKITHLEAVLHFMYHGEINVAMEDLNSVQEVGKLMQVKGLTQNSTHENDEFNQHQISVAKEEAYYDQVLVGELNIG